MGGKRIQFAVITGTLFLLSCGTDSGERGKGGRDTTPVTTPSDSVKVNEVTQFKYDMVISNIPIPFDILSTLQKTELSYVQSAMNAPSGVSKYSQNTNKAINLGIYGADMAYIITYEQYQEVSPYLKSVKKLADELGIPIAFDQRALQLYKRFEQNKDSLEKLIFSSYSEVDKTLKSNERIGLAALVVTGGWIEGLYTTAKTLGSTPKMPKTEKLYEKIYQQKFHLNQLLGLLGEFSGNDTMYDWLISDLNQVKAIYDSLKGQHEMSEKDAAAIARKIEEIRNKIVAG